MEAVKADGSYESWWKLVDAMKAGGRNERYEDSKPIRRIVKPYSMLIERLPVKKRRHSQPF